MFSSIVNRGFWTRHKGKILIGLGVIGSSYLIYKLYDSHRKRLLHSDRKLDGDQVNEFIQNQLKSYFENIQRISDITTLPYVVHELRSRISEQLDLSELRERLTQGMGQFSTLTPQEKSQLWDRLKVLSFTRTAVAAWAVTVLSLYVRVQVNILGRHLYLDFAHRSEDSIHKGDMESVSNHGRQEFLATADYLPIYGINNLTINMQKAAAEVLKEKQLKDNFSMDQLHETIMQILDLFMKIGGANYWVSYLVPKNAMIYREVTVNSLNFDESLIHMDESKLDLLMSKVRTVLSSPDFGNIMEVSLKKVVDILIEEICALNGGPTTTALAKLLPRVSQMSHPLLDEPDTNKFIDTIRNLPEIQVFYTLLYTDMT